jgi:hypothetical protein
VGCSLFNFDPALTLKELSAALESAFESLEAERAKVMQGLAPNKRGWFPGCAKAVRPPFPSTAGTDHNRVRFAA